MSRPLFYAASGSLSSTGPGDTVVLTGPEARHAAQSMRLVPGEALELADGSGRRVSATVVSVTADRLHARAEAVQDEPAARPQLVLVQALAKGDRDLMAIQAATELGIDAVRPWQSERSIVRWTGGKAGKADRTSKAVAKWEAALLAAAKQARRTRVPAVLDVLDGGAVAAVCTPGSLVLMLHEEATVPLGDAVLEATGASRAAQGPVERIVLVVGPEGGISPAEADAMTGAGAVAVLLGRNVLRSSTAGPAATAVVQQLLGRFGSRP